MSHEEPGPRCGRSTPCSRLYLNITISTCEYLKSLGENSTKKQMTQKAPLQHPSLSYNFCDLWRVNRWAVLLPKTGKLVVNAPVRYVVWHHVDPPLTAQGTLRCTALPGRIWVRQAFALSLILGLIKLFILLVDGDGDDWWGWGWALMSRLVKGPPGPFGHGFAPDSYGLAPWRWVKMPTRSRCRSTWW